MKKLKKSEIEQAMHSLPSGLFKMKISELNCNLKHQSYSVKLEFWERNYFGGKKMFLNYETSEDQDPTLLLISIFGKVPEKKLLNKNQLKQYVGKEIICFIDNHICDIDGDPDIHTQIVAFYPIKWNF